METYAEMKKRHQEEVNNFKGMFFAFSNDQFKEGLEKVNHKEGEKVVSIGAGGYIRKDRVEAFKAMLNRHKLAKKDLRRNEKTIVEGLVYELANHEYVITMDPQEAVEALGYTMETIPVKLLERAIKQAWKNYDEVNC